MASVKKDPHSIYYRGRRGHRGACRTQWYEGQPSKKCSRRPRRLTETRPRDLCDPCGSKSVHELQARAHLAADIAVVTAWD